METGGKQPHWDVYLLSVSFRRTLQGTGAKNQAFSLSQTSITYVVRVCHGEKTGLEKEGLFCVDHASLLDASSLTSQLAQVVKLSATHLTVLVDLD